MPRLFNSENAPFKTFAVASLASDATASGAWTGITTADYLLFAYGTTSEPCSAYISATDTVTFGPLGGTVSGQSTVAQTVGLVLMKNPTSGQDGGSW